MLERFAIGTRWFRRDYEFIITHNNGKVAEYKKIYEDGSVDKQIGGFIDEAGAAAQIRIHENILADKDREVRKAAGIIKARKGKTPGLVMSNARVVFYTLGLLARHAYLGLRVVEKTRDMEAEWYQGVTSKLPWEEESGYEFDSHPGTWYTKLYVALNPELVSGNVSFPNEVINEDTRACIYNTEWCRELIRRGFRLGRKHEVEKIKKSIPTEYLQHFEEGFNYGTI